MNLPLSKLLISVVIASFLAGCTTTKTYEVVPRQPGVEQLIKEAGVIPVLLPYPTTANQVFVIPEPYNRTSGGSGAIATLPVFLSYMAISATAKNIQNKKDREKRESLEPITYGYTKNGLLLTAQSRDSILESEAFQKKLHAYQMLWERRPNNWQDHEPSYQLYEAITEHWKKLYGSNLKFKLELKSPELAHLRAEERKRKYGKYPLILEIKPLPRTMVYYNLSEVVSGTAHEFTLNFLNPSTGKIYWSGFCYISTIGGHNKTNKQLNNQQIKALVMNGVKSFKSHCKSAIIKQWDMNKKPLMMQYSVGKRTQIQQLKFRNCKRKPKSCILPEPATAKP